MFGTTFVQHVIGGYEFLLRFYAPGDKIYIFGFSRGAYTARFLSEMLDNIGLLSMGNDAMIRFAWDTFSDYQRMGGTHQGAKVNVDDVKKAVKNHGAGTTDDGSKPKTKAEVKAYMDVFKSTFCRDGVRAHFLGLFDCVASVAVFDVRKNSTPYVPRAPANHIRHAISIHERRTKFKPSLFLIAPDTKPDSVDSLKEVWFAGNHGDVGGGWPLQFDPRTNKNYDYLVSDVALRWMVEEVQEVDRLYPVSPVTRRYNCVAKLKHLLLGEYITMED
jgi:uncharacterized protein (DUF2235 family)